jgi:hypothetical protein
LRGVPNCSVKKRGEFGIHLAKWKEVVIKTDKGEERKKMSKKINTRVGVTWVKSKEILPW